MMIKADMIWRIIDRHMRRDAWLDLEDIYRLVTQHGHLDREDNDSDAPGSGNPKWKRNVRNVLQRQKGLGKIDWQIPARYRLRSRSKGAWL
jgi:hypothetical protein